MQTLAPAAGGCNCGGLRYRIVKEPLTAYICHCHRCQKRTGGPFSFSLVMPADGFLLEEGEPVRSGRTLADGASNMSYSCGECYSRIYTHRTNSPTLNLRAGTLDDTSRVRPVAQMWTSSAQPWAILRDGTLTCAEQPDDFRPWIDAWKATD